MFYTKVYIKGERMFSTVIFVFVLLLLIHTDKN